MVKWMVAAALAVVLVGCSGPPFRVLAVSASGAVSCSDGHRGRIVLVAPGRVRSIRVGDVCPG
jgi:hypothetical protein